MFGWCDENGGNKVFWFETTKGGNQKLVRPDGTYKIKKESNTMFAEYGPQCLAGWQRAMLLKEEYEIWDVTEFGCTMNTMLGIPVYEEDKNFMYIFATAQHAERAVYPFLSEEKINECRKNVEDFYNSPNLQAAWHSFILHPVCVKFVAGTDEYIPVSIESIGCGEKILGRYDFRPIGTLKEMDYINEMLEDKKSLIEKVKELSYDESKWIYKQSEDRQSRFLLGEIGNKNLICCGVNPSTASPEDLDATMRKVSSLAKANGYDGYIMINLYPMRATDPNDMHNNKDEEIVKINLESIAEVLKDGCDIWAAWGTLIDKREYLKECLEQIVELADSHDCNWCAFGPATKAGHPRHPLYLSSKCVKNPFDVHGYLQKLR